MSADGYGQDIFTEPTPDPDTLANLGPLRPLAGTWSGEKGLDVHPVADGGKQEAFTEYFDLQPIDPQTNGPQLFYGLRYHEHVVRPGKPGTFHDQVGYLLWEPKTKRILMTLAIPRGQVAMAVGTVESDDAKRFTLTAKVGDPHAGIVTDAFLDRAFHTSTWEITFRVAPDGTWAYKEVTVLHVEGEDAPFDHTDSSLLTRIAEPTPNPLMLV